MRPKTLLATTGNGIARAERTQNGSWTVEFALEGQGVNCLAGDPLNAGVVYAGTQAMGILRSEDGGRSWQPAGLNGQTIKALAVSPHESGQVYAGIRPAWVFASPDGGASWSELRAFRRIPGRWWWFSPAGKPYTAYVQAIALSPTEPDQLIVGIELGAVVRSDDGGLSWSGHRRGALRDCHSLIYHTTHGSWAYEAGGTGGGAAYSQDGGLTWHKARAGLERNYGVACAADPANPEVWYVSVAPGPGRAYGQNPAAYLYRSDGGGPWQPIGWETHPMGQMPIALVTDRAAPGHLYAGLTSGDVWLSTDQGITWQQLPLNLGGIWRSLILI